MSYVLGEKVNLGLGIQADRKTPVAPQVWVPARTPTNLRSEVVHSPLRETRPSKVVSQGLNIVQKRAIGDMEFNIRARSFGYVLLNLLGKVATEDLGDGAYKHKFTIQKDSPLHPLLTLALSRPSGQDYRAPGGLIRSLAIRTPVDDLLNGTISAGASKFETKTPAYAVAFDDDDYFFRNHDCGLKIAENVAGLAAAPELEVNVLEQNISNSGRHKEVVGSLNPVDQLALTMDIGGRIEVDTANEVLQGIYDNGLVRALQVVYLREDIEIGDGENPSVKITYPRVTFRNLEPNRPIDDVEAQNIQWQAHADPDGELEPIEVELINTQESYEADGS